MRSHRQWRGGQYIALLLTFLLLFQTAPALAETAAGLAASYDATEPQILDASHLYAEAAILIEEETGRVLFAKEPDRKMSPASTTKVMTLMLALEHIQYMSDGIMTLIIIPKEAGEVPKDSSTAEIKVGEEMSYRDLLYGMMLASGNDASNAAAVISAGSLPNFIRRMNERAELLGCTNTQFANAHGYTEEGHYTTVRDMATMAREAMKDATFRSIVGTGTYIMSATNKSGGREVKNTNQFATGITGNRYPYATGIKTGYTSDAGRCLVASATDPRGVKLISVVFKCPLGNSNATYIDSKRLMEYGWTRFDEYSFDEFYRMVPLTVQVENFHEDDPGEGALQLAAIRNTSIDYRAVSLDEDVLVLAAQIGQATNVHYTHSLVAPIAEGEIIGSLSFPLPDGSAIVTADLIASRTVEAAPAPTIFDIFDAAPFWMIGAAMCLIALLVIMMSAQASARKKRMRRRQAAMRSRYR